MDDMQNNSRVSEPRQIDDLIHQVIPAMFAKPNTIGEYGRLASNASSISDVSDQLDRAPVTMLAQKMTAIITALKDAAPEKIAKPANWFQRLSGSKLEVMARYKAARKDLEELIADADVAAQAVRDALTSLDRLSEEHVNDCGQLDIHIEAGREFLTLNPSAGAPHPETQEFENHRERFARKLANLSMLRASHEVSIAQIKLAKSNAIDILDRFEETARVLVPVWRQATLALATSKNLEQHIVAAATKTHNDLVASLTTSVNNINR